MTTVEEEEGSDVYVYVYDLSRGLAAVLSAQILGTHIPAIYHTSTVINNREIYIDQGIKVNSPPGTTKYGQPIERKLLGKSYIPDEIIDEFIEDLNARDDKKYHASAYDLFNNNCNHFTDVLLQFLVDQPLEDRILKLPETVLNTPNGRMLQQMLNLSMEYNNNWL